MTFPVADHVDVPATADQSLVADAATRVLRHHGKDVRLDGQLSRVAERAGFTVISRLEFDKKKAKSDRDYPGDPLHSTEVRTDETVALFRWRSATADLTEVGIFKHGPWEAKFIEAAELTAKIASRAP